jgi:hypothetical protein
MSGIALADTTQDRREDRDFYDAVRAGLQEELLGDNHVIQNNTIRLLSMIIEGFNLFVGPIVLVRLEMNLSDTLLHGLIVWRRGVDGIGGRARS